MTHQERLRLRRNADWLERQADLLSTRPTVVLQGVGRFLTERNPHRIDILRMLRDMMSETFAPLKRAQRMYERATRVRQLSFRRNRRRKSKTRKTRNVRKKLQ